MVYGMEIEGNKKIYDFESVISRKGKGSVKWDQMRQWMPDVADDVVPLTVADMEFRTAPEITKGLQAYLEDNVLGYSIPTEDYYQAVVDWQKRRHNFELEKEWILTSPGVVSALYAAVRAYTQPGEGVVVMTPVYYPFFEAIEKAGRKVVRNPLLNRADDYTIDFKGLEHLCRKKENKLIIFCSPHNPVGRVWTEEELARLADIVIRYDMIIIADEIHHDLIMPGYEHKVFQTLSHAVAERTITCTSPSKTFNLAGLCTSNIIIKNVALRKKLSDALGSVSCGMVGTLGLEGCRIAYNEAEQWLDHLIPVIDRNQHLVRDFFAANFPKITAPLAEGTYLQWVNFKGLGLSAEELERFMREEAQFFTDEGYIFGEEGEGYERINLAAPTKVIEDALNRLGEALYRTQANN